MEYFTLSIIITYVDERVIGCTRQSQALRSGIEASASAISEIKTAYKLLKSNNINYNGGSSLFKQTLRWCPCSVSQEGGSFPLYIWPIAGKIEDTRLSNREFCRRKINSAIWPSKWCLLFPNRIAEFRNFRCKHSMHFVWAPLSGSAKFVLWFRVKWLKYINLKQSYPFQQPLVVVVLVICCSWWWVLMFHNWYLSLLVAKYNPLFLSRSCENPSIILFLWPIFYFIHFDVPQFSSRASLQHAYIPRKENCTNQRLSSIGTPLYVFEGHNRQQNNTLHFCSLKPYRYLYTRR